MGRTGVGGEDPPGVLGQQFDQTNSWQDRSRKEVMLALVGNKVDLEAWVDQETGWS